MKYFLSILSMVCIGQMAHAQSITPKFDPIFTTTKGAIGGYDPVAYFTDHQPVKGAPQIMTVWGGAEWHFSSIAHRDSFQMSPEKFAPQYGGYCAYGWSKGYPAKVDPTAWTIVGGELYLNYNAAVKSDWDKKKSEYIQKADANWAKAKQ